MMTHKGTLPLETERLILRRFTESDTEAMFKNWASDPDAPKHMTWELHSDVAETKGVLSDWINSYNSSDYYHWAIELKEIGEVIGSIGCESVNNEIKSVHMGYCIGSKFWHKGYMTEALKVVIDFLFSQVGVNRIESRHDPLNPHSGGVMRKAGMTYEGTMRQNMMVKGRLCDSAYYAILAEDYFRSKNMTHKGTLPLETERLILRRFTVDDADAMFRNWANGQQEIAESLNYKSDGSFGTITDWISQYQNLNTYHWAIVLKSINEPIGYIYAHDGDDVNRKTAIGYAIGVKWWHQGIVTEAAQRVLQFFFEDVGYNRIEAQHNATNPRSGGVMLNCGMKYEGTSRQCIIRSGGELVDRVHYAILAEDYFKEQKHDPQRHTPA